MLFDWFNESTSMCQNLYFDIGRKHCELSSTIMSTDLLDRFVRMVVNTKGIAARKGLLKGLISHLT